MLEVMAKIDLVLALKKKLSGVSTRCNSSHGSAINEQLREMMRVMPQ